MRFKPVLRALGLLMICESILMIPSLLIALIYGDGDWTSFVFSMLILLGIGVPLAVLIKTRVHNLYAREGFALVGLGWIILSAFGMLPFLFSGVIRSPVDAFFETVSGFTTTGSSILPYVEGLPRGVLFWRNFTNWIGGMGVLMFTIALLPQLGFRNMEILRAESPGPNPEKLVPRIRNTAIMLYKIYFGLSLLLFVLLLFTGLSPYDSAVSTFAAAGTGGFSVLNASIGGYNNPAAEVILGIFMLLFGVNFSVYFMLILRRWKKALSNQEMIFYFAVVAVSVLVIAIDIGPKVGNGLLALRQSFFQVSTIITTTGFATTDFNGWPMLSQCILIFLMLIGACAGSTGGGLKVVRMLIGLKVMKRELHYLMHPRVVQTINLDGKPLDDTTIRSVLAFFFMYVVIIIVATLVVSLDRFDFLTSFTSVLATLSNIGPGLGAVGPTGNFGAFSVLSKLVLSMCMLIGRLEIMPILLLFMPSLWRRS